MTPLMMASLIPTAMLAACTEATPAAEQVATQPAAENVAVLAQADVAADSARAAKAPDVIYVPTPQPVVEAMLEMAKVGKGDVLYDLGSGDGRIPITAARKYGIKATGIEIDPERIAEAQANVREAGVGNLVTIRQEDLFEADFSEATVVTLYLLEGLNKKLRPKLLSELKPGSRIVSHSFGMGDWEPEAQQTIDGSRIYMWTVPPRN